TIDLLPTATTFAPTYVGLSHACVPFAFSFHTAPVCGVPVGITSKRGDIDEERIARARRALDIRGVSSRRAMSRSCRSELVRMSPVRWFTVVYSRVAFEGVRDAFAPIVGMTLAVVSVVMPVPLTLKFAAMSSESGFELNATTA